MADDSPSPPLAAFRPPDARGLLRYIEDMLLELAQLSASVGESALAASLTITAIQAGAASEHREARGSG